MAHIRVDVPHTVINGSTVSFLAPCPCNAVDGLKVYFPNDKGIATNQTFVFVDTHGNNLTGVGNLFLAGAIVKAILSVSEGKAYLQNADTNAYLEGRFDDLDYKIENIPTPDVSGQINAHNTDTSAHADIRAAVSNAQTAANNAQTTANGKAPMYTYGTDDLEAGVTPLETGKLHFVYE